MSEKKMKRNHLPIRLNILFFLVFLLFSALILRLGIVQIVQGEEFQEQLDRTINFSIPIEAPRGLMYDRFGNILVDNELLFTVTYTNRNTPQNEMIETAEKLNKYITIEEPRYSVDRDRKEYWGIMNSEDFVAKLTLEEANELELNDRDVHQKRIDRITERELKEFFTQEVEEVFLLWREFNLGYNNLPHKVKVGITYEEAAQIMENLENLPGVEIIDDSKRVYVYDETLRNVFGSVGSIPRDDIDHFLANGYERNEEVGTSYIERQYEAVLTGRKGRQENAVDSRGNLLRNPEIHEGSRGNDLVLTFDMELQQRIEQIVKEEVSKVESRYIADPNAYVVMMEPHTGEVLSLVGYLDQENRQTKNDFEGTFTKAFEPGSTIKGATVLAGLDTGVVTANTRIFDRPITNIPNTPMIRSHRPLGYVDALSALEQSSNIYMVEVAMRLINYIPGVSGRNWGNFQAGYETLRSYYHQFGLGVNTGIDLPNESSGLGGESSVAGLLLMLSYGQYDTYTPLQLAQYVSTIANDGYRIAPRVVKEIREPLPDKRELGPISQQMVPEILNKVDVDESHMNTIRNGFHRVVYGNRGTGRALQASYNPAGKTGTAQVRVNRRDAHNQTFVGYAPYDNPEVAFSVVVHGMHVDEGGVSLAISKRVLDAYFELKEKRRGPLKPGEEYMEITIDDEEEEEEDTNE
ncbi:peptidoglycan D,D-transpeptidase FtsI family protein [Evansella sp. AB-rgal1]|uniref:peptidoglycan D,D-transpeptidase FtsI family protein n=1 Tax=Evansella sp. AB-rgal1 TaxID=3242696 RepID=UPI00359E910E